MSVINLIMLSLSEIIGDFGFEKFANSGLTSTSGFTQGMVGYIGVIYFLIKNLGGANVMWTNGMWDGMSGIMETVAAYFILGERLQGMQYAGILCIAAGLVILKTCGGTGNKS